MKNNLRLLAASVVLAAFVASLQAQPYYVAGEFNGWNASTNVMNDDGDGSWSLTITGYTAGATHEWKVTDGDWDEPNWPGSNVASVYDTNGNFTFRFYPGTINDGWRPTAFRVGYNDPGIDWELMGSANGWTTPLAMLTNMGGGVHKTTFTFATNGTYYYKYRKMGDTNWNSARVGPSFGKDGDLSLTTTVSNETRIFQLDLPNGRYLDGDPLPAVTNQVSFVVNMEVPIAIYDADYTDNNGFSTNDNRLFVHGSWDNWTVSTNYQLFQIGASPVYSNTLDVVAYQGETIYYKFYGDQDGPPYPGEETPLLSCGADRTLEVTSTNVSAPLVYWSDRQLSDPTNLVSFVVDLTVQQTVELFDETTDKVYVRGSFNGWLNNVGGTDPAWELDRIGSSFVYSNTLEIVEPAGASNCVKQYKFFTDPGLGYEYINNREFTLTGGVTQLPSVYFNDVDSTCPYVVGNTNWVTFTVDMTGVTNAVARNGPTLTFTNGVSAIFVNGNFADDFWWEWKDDNGAAVPPATYQLTNVPATSNYSGVIPMPPGKEVRMQYKYSVEGWDNEAGSEVDHVRWLRTSPGSTSYAVSDVWTGGNPENIANLQEDELSLSASDAGPGSVQIDYWSVPCAELQSSTNIAGPWNKVVDAVDVGSTNVNVSSTLEQEYWRLYKP